MLNKVFSYLFSSPIAADHSVRHVYMDLLILAEDGVVDMTVDAIAGTTGVPVTEARSAINWLCKNGCLLPLTTHPWGWQIVAYKGMYDDLLDEARRQYYRDRQRAYRKRNPKQRFRPAWIKKLLRPLYRDLDIDAELVKMREALNGEVLTRSFAINWLNKVRMRDKKGH